LESEFVEVEMAMAAVENRIGHVPAADKIIYFGFWEGTLVAHFPGLRVVVGRGPFCFVVNDYLNLVPYFDSVGVSHQENCL
jgi:hypothetical protein